MISAVASKVEAFFTHSESVKSIILSILLIILFQIVRVIFSEMVEKNKNLKSLEKINYKRKIKNYLNILTIILFIILWFSQIQAVFVSLFAVAAAIVLATKELIMSFMGGVLIKMNNYFRLGDRIEIDGVRGFVVEKSLTVTKILEIGPEKSSQQTTGDVIVIPNSVMLSKSVKNESYFKDYSIKSFVFSLPEGDTLKNFESHLIKWGQRVCHEYLEDAQKVIGSFCKKEGLIIPKVEPRSKISINEQKKIEVILKIPVKNQSIGDAEQEIFRMYINYIENSTNKNEKKMCD